MYFVLTLSMNKLQRNVAVLASFVLAIAAYAVPSHVQASAVSVSAFTATSTPAYVNTGFATTTRAKVGDTIQYQLTTTGGPPLIAPQINILNTGSTTMSSGGANSWYYATTTTANASVWNDGPVTFKVSVGGTTGVEATTTVVAVTSGSNITFDKTGPTLNSVSWNDVDGSTDFSATDTLVLTFNETMATSTVVTGNVDTVLALSGGHTFGTTPGVAWNTAGTILTLTLGTGETVASGDTVDPTTAVKDAIGNNDATPTPLAITDNVAPPTPSGLADTNFGGSVTITLTSAGSSVIRYTKDGSTPTCTTGTLYASSFAVTSTMTVKAIACDSLDNASAVASATYTRIGGGSGGGGGHHSSGGGSSSSSDSSTTSTSVTVASLMVQLTQLQAQLAALTGDAGGAGSFNRDLDIGATGPDVTALQNWLIGKGYAITAGATGYFGAQTQAALAAYQAANGISPAAGYFGPKTRAVVGH